MNFIKTKIKGLIIVESKVFGDQRGFFFESYSQKEFEDNGITVQFVQDNQSRSTKNVLRGLHLQRPPYAQDKLIRVTRGNVFDVAVDVRSGSPTFGQWESIILSEENNKMFFIPKGFLHGFVTLSEIVDFEYKVSNYYSKESEIGIAWNDPDLNINWPVTNPILSEKDKVNKLLKEVDF